MLAILGCIGLLSCLGARTAEASTFGISLSSGSGSNYAYPGCGVTTSYSSDSGGSATTSTGAVGCSISYGVPVPTGLTSGSVYANSQSPDGSGGTRSAAGSAAVSLATGSLHAFASATDNNGSCCAQGSAGATLWDTLTFNIAGASASTVTNIPIFFEVDGTASDPANESWSAFLQFSGCGFFNACGIDPGGTVVWSQGYDGQGLTAVSGNLANEDGLASIAWMTPTVSNANDLDIEGILSLTGPSVTLEISADLEVLASDGVVDYGDTAGISFQLPQGVTFTSASGDFLTPEPASLALLSAGLLGVGWTRRRRT